MKILMSIKNLVEWDFFMSNDSFLSHSPIYRFSSPIILWTVIDCPFLILYSLLNPMKPPHPTLPLTVRRDGSTLLH